MRVPVAKMYPVDIPNTQLVGYPSMTSVHVPSVAPVGGVGCAHCAKQLDGVPLQLAAVHVMEPHKVQLLPVAQSMTQLEPESRVSFPSGQEPADRWVPFTYSNVRELPVHALAVNVG